MDYLHITVDDNQLKQISSLGLAHMGDCVYEIMTRSYLVLGGKTTAKSLHRATTELVCAQAQAKGAQAFLPRKKPTLFITAAMPSRKTFPNPAPKQNTPMPPVWRLCLAGCI